MIDKLKLCGCGGEVLFSNEERCESCFARDTKRWHGRSQRVKSYPYLKEDVHANHRTDSGAGHNCR